MLNGMSAASLPVRIVYAAFALPAGWSGGLLFLPWPCCQIRPSRYPKIDPAWMAGNLQSGLYRCGPLAFTATLIALTLPWSRHRKRRGRLMRALQFRWYLSWLHRLYLRTWVHRAHHDLAFPHGLRYTMAYTFVRYGLLDQARHGSDRVDGIDSAGFLHGV